MTVCVGVVDTSSYAEVEDGGDSDGVCERIASVVGVGEGVGNGVAELNKESASVGGDVFVGGKLEDC